MWLKLNPRSSEPIYLQIIHGVKNAVARGVLQPGEKLSSVRELATEFAVNHNTVAKAYQELEREKVIEVIRGRGTFITLHPVPANHDERLAEMQSALAKWLVEAHHLGMSEKDFVDLVHDVVERWKDGREVGE